MAAQKIPQPWRFLSSYGLTIALLAILMVLVFFGTLDQRTLGIYKAQVKYFNSVALWIQPFEVMFGETHAWAHLAVPCLGALGTLALLSVNLVVSLAVRFRWKARSTGLLISHLGLVMLMAGSLVTYLRSQDGALSLFEGDEDNVFVSYHEFEFLVLDTSAPSHDTVIEFPPSHIKPGAELRHDFLPFAIKIGAKIDNGEPEAAQEITPEVRRMLGRSRFAIKNLPPIKDHEQNRPGLELELIGSNNKTTVGSVISGAAGFYEDGGRAFQLILRRRSFDLPFAIEMLDATKEVHPNTSIPRHYASRVKLKEDGLEREVLISMNQPLRHEGYTFFQSGYDEVDGRVVSTLAVVRNPAEEVPYIACLLVFLGMLLHFGIKLFRFVSSRGSAATPAVEAQP